MNVAAGSHPFPRLRRAFSPQRLFGGIAVILFTAALIGGCTYSAGHGGLYFLILAIPMFTMGGGMVAKPFRFVCNACHLVVNKPLQSVPLSMQVIGPAHNIALSGDVAQLDYLLRNAPIPDNRIAYCALSARVCPCGESGYLSMHTYKSTGSAGAVMPDKTHVELGGEIGPQQIRMIAEASHSRWAWTQQQRGFNDPFPKG